MALRGFSPYQQDDYMQRIMQMMKMRQMMQMMEGRKPPDQRQAGPEQGGPGMGPGMEAGIGASGPTNPEELSFFEKLKAFLRS